MEPRISLVTLGVADITQAADFYGRLGFHRAAASNENVVFMQAGGVVLSLFGRAALAKDACISSEVPGVSAPCGFAGVTIAHNTRTEAEVDAVLAEAVAAGGRLVKAAQKVFWGGYSGYFADPDGHLWEVAHNPFFAMDADGAVRLD